MKKIIAFALIFVLAFSLASCDLGALGGGTPADAGEVSSKILAMYSRSIPTESVTTITSEFAGRTLTSTVTLTSGKIDGKLNAAVLTEVKQELRSVAEGSNATIMGEISTTTTVTEYLEGRGTRINGGSWDPSGVNFSPFEGSITLNVTDSKILNVKENGKTYTFVVAAENTESVFGKAIGANVSVSLTHDGASIVGVKLDYIEPATSDLPEIQISIKVDYSYSIKNINIG